MVRTHGGQRNANTGGDFNHVAIQYILVSVNYSFIPVNWSRLCFPLGRRLFSTTQVLHLTKLDV